MTDGIMITVRHVSEDTSKYPDTITISGSTKRAGYTVRVNADDPHLSTRRIGVMAELAREATRQTLGSQGDE
jgi:hypothetical protein